MKTIRSFLAIKLDLETVEALTRAQRRLRERCSEEGIKVAWVPPPNMHVTMRFLGTVTEPMALALKERLEQNVRTMAPFELKTVGLGAFPSLSKPRVIWAGLTEGTEEISRLYSVMNERLEEAGFASDDKPFRAHVTLGRIKDGDTVALAPCIAEFESEIFGSTVVRNLYCYRSDLSPQGAEHHALWRLPFRGRNVGPGRQGRDYAWREEQPEEPVDRNSDADETTPTQNAESRQHSDNEGSDSE